MKKQFFIILLLFPLMGFGQWNTLGEAILGEAEDDNFGYSSSINASGTVMIAGGPWNTNNAELSGHARVFEWDGMDWVQRGTDIDGVAENDFSGQGIAINAIGNRIAVGAVNGENATSGLDAGTVKIYDWNGTDWNQVGSTLEGIGHPVLGSDYYGAALSFSSDGNTIAIGAPFSNTDNGSSSGLAQIYQWDGNDWVQMGNDILGEQNRDDFGWSISINDSGTIVAIGAKVSFPFGPNSKGYVQIYKWDGSDWIQRGSTLDGEVDGDEYGRAISLDASGDILAVGASGYDVVSANLECTAYIYEWDGMDWVQRGSTLSGDEDIDQFGEAISLNANGNILAVGGATFLSTGHAWIFEWNGTEWVQQEKLSGENTSDIFGSSLTLNAVGNILAVGAWGNQDIGHVQVFENQSIVSTQELGQFDLNYFPNPTTNHIYLSGSTTFEWIKLYDVTGKELISIKGTNNEMKIDLEEFKPGTYFLETHAQGQIRTIKVIKT